MKKLISLAAGCIFLFACNNEKKDDNAAARTDSTAVTAKAETPQSEFADAKYSEIAKNGMAKLSSGDVAGWMNDYADTAVYVWNNGDSLAGKKAITDYWTKRRGEVIDSLKFLNQIWVPLKVNKPQSVEAAGVWALGWYMCEAKYKTGKKMVQWMHMDLHFNSADKIDRLIHYLDRVPINAATTK
jgi:ketosteroid isomerase-like protein